jgi:hypothetical protein
MKRNIVRSLVGFFIAVTIVLAYSSSRSYIFDKGVQIKVSEAGRSILLDTFPNADIKEIMIEPSDNYVNFVHDKLYKVEIVYENKGKFKKIIFDIGVYKRRFIVPSQLELLELDQQAKAIFKR